MQVSCSLLMPGNNCGRPPARQSFSFLPDGQESWGLGTASPVGGNFPLQQPGHGFSATSMHTTASSGTSADIREERKTQRKDLIQFWGMIHHHAPKQWSFMASPALLRAAETKGLTWPPATPFLLSVAQPLILETQFSFVYSSKKP